MHQEKKRKKAKMRTLRNIIMETKKKRVIVVPQNDPSPRIKKRGRSGRKKFIKGNQRDIIRRLGMG